MKPVEGTESVPQRKPPGVERIRVPRGELCIITDWCKGCGFCVEFCPKHVLENSEKFNRKGYHPPRVANPEVCNHCDMCEMICPDFAIFTVKLADAASGDGSADEESK
jgi:2-oxoglutarate ferredoxin oxidoreductase subunit delta